MKKVLLILLPILLFNCNKDKNIDTIQYDLKIDKCLDIADTEYELCLESINDSRCPSDVDCVWEGDAVVSFKLNSNTENKSFTLQTHKSFQQDTLINGFKIKLLGVSPYPISTTPTSQSDYSVELSISDQ